MQGKLNLSSSLRNQNFKYYRRLGTSGWLGVISRMQLGEEDLSLEKEAPTHSMRRYFPEIFSNKEAGFDFFLGTILWVMGGGRFRDSWDCRFIVITPCLDFQVLL